MRTRTFAGAAYFTDNLTPHYPLAKLRTETLQMGIPSLITETVVYDNGIAVTGFPSHLHHLTIACGIYFRSRMGREVHSCMKLGSSVNRVDACSVTGSSLT